MPVKTSASHPMNLSPLLLVEQLPDISRAIFPALETASLTPLRPDQPWLLGLTEVPTLRKVPPPPAAQRVNRPANLAAETISTVASGRQIGNLLLSSCPGKKVRLTAPIPVGGRSAICRDVRTDLLRMKETGGVGALICCLNDTELAFLGAPWEEYSIAARELGLDVMRYVIV